MNAVTPEFRPEVLETACEWDATQMADPAIWTERLSPAEIDELAAAVEHAFGVSDDFLAIGKEAFPLPTLAARLKLIERELMDGRGFVRLRGLPRERWSNDEMNMALAVQIFHKDSWVIEHFMFNLAALSNDKKFVNAFTRLSPSGS